MNLSPELVGGPRLRACLLFLTAGFSLMPGHAAAQSDVPVPKQSFEPHQLYQKLRTFTADEIGWLPTFAAMHRGHLVISGGRSEIIGGTGGKLSTWRLSLPATPNVVNPSRVGVHANNGIWKSHSMGFSGELTQVRAGKFTIYDLGNMAAPKVHSVARGGISSTHSSCWAGKYIYTGGEGYSTNTGFVDIWDASDPDSPVYLRSIDVPALTGFRCASVYVLGNVMVVSASLTRGVATFDLSNPADPRLLNVFRGDIGASTYTTYLSGNRLYGGGSAGGLFVYDLSDPRDIRLIGHLNPGGSVRYPVLQDEFIHVGNIGNEHYQKIRVDTMPPVLVADVPGFPRAEIAIPIGNLVFVGAAAQSPDSTGWLIPHSTTPDTRGPEVNAIRPVNGETNVGLQSMIGVSFTDQLDGPSINASTLIVRPQGGAPLAGTYSHMSGIVNFSPAAPLAPNTVYEVVVMAGGIKDSSGNPVANQTVSIFSTGSLNPTGVGLALHYALDETTGATASDRAGAHPGTLVNFPATPWTPQSAVGPGALNFDGVNDHIRTPDFDTGNTFSVSAWVRIPSGTSGLHTIVGNTSNDFSADGWKLFVYASGRVRLQTGNGDTGAGIGAQTEVGALPFDRWVHLVLTVNRAAGAARFWIDGADATAASGIRTDFQTAGTLNWGRMTNGTNHLLGALDDLRIYNRVLGETDVLALRDLAPLMLAHWRFNGTPNDDTPRGNDLSLHSAATYLTSGTAEGPAALSLGAGAAYAVSPAIELGSAFTASGWVKISSGNDSLNTIIANARSGNTTDGWKLFAFGSAHATAPGRVRMETGNGSDAAAVQTEAGALPFDRWAHVAVAVDRAKGRARIYINGVDRTAGAETVRTDFKTNDPIYLGQMGSAGHRLHGALDDVRLHGRSLEPREIAELAIGKLLGHWPMDNQDEDRSGFGRTLVRSNGATFWPDSADGSHSLFLDGVDARANLPAFSLGDRFTISLWAYLPAGLPAGSRTLIANSPGGAGAGGNGFRLFVNNSNTGNQAIILETGNGSQQAGISAPAGTFVPGQWNHLALVVNRSGGIARIYLNRKKVSTSSAIRPDFANNLALHLGSLSSGAAPWQGSLDEVRIYADAANDTQIAVLGFGSPNEAPVIHDLASNTGAQTTGGGVTFAVNATDPNVGEQLRHYFDYGDGTNSGWQTGNAATHTYTAPGRYIVTSTVSDGYTTVTRSMTQIIYNQPTATPPSISSEMVFDAARGKVWCVVPDGNDHDNNPATPPVGVIVRFDAATLAVEHRVNLGPDVEPVACALRPGGAELWIVCKNSRLPDGQLKILNAATGALLHTITLGRGYLPSGIAFAPDGSGAFIACEGAEGVLKYNPATRALLATRDIGGPARGIAVDATSTRVLVTRFRSPDTGGQVLELAASSLAPVRTLALAPDTTTPDSPSSARGLPNYLMQAVISPDGRKLWIPAKKDNIYRGLHRDGLPLNHENTVRPLVAQLDLVANQEPAGSRIDMDDSHFPTALRFSPRGDLVFAAMLGNEQVTVIDAVTRDTLTPIDTTDGTSELGHAPSDLCVSPDGQRLYVHNFLERRVRVFDISRLTAGTGSTAPLLGTVALVTREPLSPPVLQGKKLFHNARDPRLAREGYMSCASCHLGGDHDGRVWDLGNFGEGLRHTIDLRGRGGLRHGALHWSANFDEVQDFEGQIRALSGGSGLIADGVPHPPLGAPNAGRSPELDALAAYVASLDTGLRSPLREPDGRLTPAAINGQAHFVNLGCIACHTGDRATDSTTTTFLRHDVGTINAQSGQRLGGPLDGIDTPTLHALWSKSTYLHRGQAATLAAVFNSANAPSGPHARYRELSAAGQNQLIEYLLQLEAPAGGDTDLVLHYALDETTGVTANDRSGARPGTLVNFPESPWTPQSAVGPGALDFDGVNDHIRTPDFNTGNTFSVSAWVRIPSGASGLRTIVGNTNNDFSADGWKLFVYDSGRVRLQTGNGSAGVGAQTEVGALPFDRWVHLVLTVNRSAGAARLWIDGIDATAASGIRTDFRTTGTLNWGRMTNGTNHLRGTLDDLRIYNRVLGETDILALRDLAPLALAHWRFNHTPNDDTPRGNDLSLHSAATYLTSGTAEGPAALSLGAGAAYAVSPVIELGSAFTASGWVKVSSGNDSLNTIISNARSGNTTDGWKLFAFGSTHATAPGRVQMETGNGSVGAAVKTAAGALPFDRWAHVAVAVDRAQGRARIYINGVDRTAGAETVCTDFKTGDRIYLGQMGSAGHRLHGSLDDVRLFRRHLEPREIAELAIGKLLGHWTLDNHGEDRSGFGRTLVRSNGATFSPDAADGSHGLFLDGVDARAKLPAFSLSDRFTISLWAYLPAGLPAGSRTLIANSPGGAGAGGNGFRLFVNNSNTGNNAIILETGNGSQQASISAPAGTFVPGQWNHLALVVNRSGGIARIYLNRQKVSTSSTIRSDFANNLALHLGSLSSGAAPWQGSLDEVRIYADAANDDQIAVLGFGSPD